MKVEGKWSLIEMGIDVGSVSGLDVFVTDGEVYAIL